MVSYPTMESPRSSHAEISIGCEARQATEPVAPDVDGLFVAAGTRSEAMAAGDARGSPGKLAGKWWECGAK